MFIRSHEILLNFKEIECMRKTLSICLSLIMFFYLFSGYGFGFNSVSYAKEVEQTEVMQNKVKLDSTDSSIGILSTSVYPDSSVVKFGEKIYINYSFSDTAHPVLINIYKDGNLQSDYIYKQSSWGGSFSYEPKDEGSYRFVVKPTDQEYYTNECTVTVYKDRIIFIPGTMGSELFLGQEKKWMPSNKPSASLKFLA